MAKPELTRNQADQIAAERDRLQNELFRVLDEQRRLRISIRHPNYIRWKQRFDDALAAKRAFDEQWPRD